MVNNGLIARKIMSFISLYRVSSKFLVPYGKSYVRSKTFIRTEHNEPFHANRGWGKGVERWRRIGQAVYS